MRVLIKNGKVVGSRESRVQDVLVEGGSIVKTDVNLECADARIIDATGKYVFPGAIDPHTHLDMPFGTASTSDDFCSGTMAAILGGVTTIIDFSLQSKGQTLAEAIDVWHKRADSKCYSDYSFHFAVTDCTPQVIEELASLRDKTGVSSVKMFLAYKGLFQIDDGTMYKVFRAARDAGILVGLHCENGDIIDVLSSEAISRGQVEPVYHAYTRPDYIEAEAISRAALIAGAVDAALYVVHLSSAKGYAAAMNARSRGQKIYLETCPQYLLLDDSRYFESDFAGAKYVMSPPLRKPYDTKLLWQALGEDNIDVVATDHCAFTFAAQKQVGRADFRKIPNGAPGVETRFGLMYTYGVADGKITENQLVETLCTNPAKIFGLYPRKGEIIPGADADIVIYDPSGESTITVKELHQAVDYTPYEGFIQKGHVEHVFLRGKQVVSSGKLLDQQPQGIFLARNAR